VIISDDWDSVTSSQDHRRERWLSSRDCIVLPQPDPSAVFQPYSKSVFSSWTGSRAAMGRVDHSSISGPI
jgi:hypothetical protein